MLDLERFGFTPTECKVYESLLRLGPSTGYSVAKASGLARANAYQALDALVRRGAARRSATAPARYAPQSPDVPISDLERLFRRDVDALRHALRSLPRQARGELAVATHDTWSAFTTAAGAAIRAARADVLAVAGPWAPAVLDALGDTGAATVRAVSLGAPAPARVTIRPVEPAELVAYWSGLPVAVVVDRTLAFSGVVNEDGDGAGVETASAAIVPFVRHLLRRETSKGADA